MKYIYIFFSLGILLTNLSCDNSVAPSDKSLTSTKLIYISKESGRDEIYSKDLATSKIVQLTNADVEKNPPIFFPSGNKILYSTNSPNGGQICSINFDGTGYTLLEDSCNNYSQIDISANGNLIVYEKAVILPNSYSSCIALMKSDGYEKKIISSVNCGTAKFSTDGNLICYIKFGNNLPNKIMIYDVNNNHTDSISIPGLNTTMAILNPKFSPKGDNILANIDLGSGYALYTIGLDGNNFKRISPYNFFTQDFQYSPDGKYIVSSQLFKIYVCNSDGSNLIKLSSDDLFEINPSFSLNSSKIVMASQSKSTLKSSIVIMDVNGQDRQNLVENNNELAAPILR